MPAVMLLGLQVLGAITILGGALLAVVAIRTRGDD